MVWIFRPGIVEDSIVLFLLIQSSLLIIIDWRGEEEKPSHEVGRKMIRRNEKKIGFQGQLGLRVKTDVAKAKQNNPLSKRPGLRG